jgi:CDP-diglyceride synthetase
MSYATENLKNVVASIAGLVVVAAIGVWQFYAYVTFKDAHGLANADGGGMHLLLAIVMAVFACFIGFLVFSIFLRHDTDDDLHITFAPLPNHLSSKADLQ